MTTANHTPLAYGAAATAAVLEAPLGELDAAIVALAASLAGSTLPISVTDAEAASGQKVVPVAATTGFLAGMSIWIGDVAGTFEVRVIDTIQAGVSLTVTVNLTNTYAAGKIVSASPSEIAAARGGEADLWTLVRKTAGTVGTSFPGSPVAGDICTRSDRDGARYRYSGAAWVQMTVPNVTAFWATPSTNDRAFRTDLGEEFYYATTRWLSVAVHTMTFPPTVLAPLSGTGIPLIAVKPHNGTHNLALIRAICGSEIGAGTNSAGNCWEWQVSADVAGAIGASFTTVGDGNAAVSHIVDLSAVTLTSSGSRIYITATKSGTAGNLTTCAAVLEYRTVAT